MAKVLLVIEDDPLVSRMYQKALTFEGFDIVMAQDGREGLEKAKKTKPDLILLDIMMPRMNGMEVLERLKVDAELKDIPVVMLTNLAGTQDAENAVKRGAIAYLVKSEYKPKEIADKVKQLLTESPQQAQDQDKESN